jgi:hypothetical protein
MSRLDNFIVEGHRKIIDHYRRLHDTARSEAERERFEQRIAEEDEALRLCISRQSHHGRRAA